LTIRIGSWIPYGNVFRMPETVKCDILLAGAGMAGLSLLYRALKSGVWTKERIIIVDQSDKTTNDKTWSFWRKPDVKGVASHLDVHSFSFQDVIHHQWKDLTFISNDGRKIPLQCGNYSYNSIRSIDFYEMVMSYLKEFPSITFVHEEILSCSSSGGAATLVTPTRVYTAPVLFNSIFTKPEIKNTEQYFLQHFKGLRIRINSVSTASPPMNVPPVNEAYLMDFRTGQENGTSFFYTLPLKDNELFIEYTLFSKSLLESEAYDKQLKLYLEKVLKISSYEVLEEEFGAIPMTDFRFKRFEGNIINIGSAGGDTRASTGYTFMTTQKTISRILQHYQKNGTPYFKQENLTVKHHLYDSTLLNVLDKEKYQGHQLFTDLFSNCSAKYIFPFLDGESSVIQDLPIMKSLRIWPFLQSFAAAVFRRI